MLTRIATAPLALLYVAVVVLDRSPTARRATALTRALLCIGAVALLSRS